MGQNLNQFFIKILKCSLWNEVKTKTNILFLRFTFCLNYGFASAPFKLIS